MLCYLYRDFFFGFRFVILGAELYYIELVYFLFLFDSRTFDI